MTSVLDKGDNQEGTLLVDMQELTPVQIDENTTLKIPCEQSLPTAGQQAQVRDQDTDASFVCASTDDPSMTDVLLTDEQLNKLVSCYNSYPKDLLKNTLLTWYASCDKKLNEVRLDLFTILSCKDDFPFVLKEGTVKILLISLPMIFTL